MNYLESTSYLHSVPRFLPRDIVNGKTKFDLDMITNLLERLHNPQDGLKFVHVAGTNGKGSTVTFISSILKESGLKTGTFTSPFFNEPTESIKINNIEISRSDFVKNIEKVKEASEYIIEEDGRGPSQFEQLCACAFLYFAENKCDIVVLEVGLGGRYDATNVIKTPELAVIMTISLDHTEILGDALEKIAYEKAGIIKKRGKVLLYPQSQKVYEVFESVCEELDAALYNAVMPVKLSRLDFSGQTFVFPTKSMRQNAIFIPLLGEYQAQNAAMAINAAIILRENGYCITDEQIKNGLANVKWPGRFEVLHDFPKILVYGSHNEEGVEMLCTNLKQYFPQKKVIFIVGVLSDKAYKKMLMNILPIAKEIYTVTPRNPRALPACKLAKFFGEEGYPAVACDSIKLAIEVAQKGATEEDIICIFGSLYVIGEAKNVLKKLLPNLK